MKIAFLTDGIYPSLIGGMQKHSYYLVKYLAKAKVLIDLYYFVPDNSEDVLLFSKEELEYISLIKIDYPKFPNIPGKYLVKEYLYSQRIYKKLRNRDNADFIYSQGFTSWAFSKKIKTPIGLNLHGFEMFQMSNSKKENYKKKLLQVPAKQSFKKADYVFTFGAKFDKLLSELKISKDKQRLFFNGISNDWMCPRVTEKKKTRTFLFVGRYEKRKGIEILNSVIRNLINENIKFKFVFVGPIPSEKQIKHKQVSYKGSISDENKMKKIYAEADIYVLPSLSEGMPTVILEAMALGLAIIATDVGAVRQMVSDENGILIHANNTHKLEKAIKKMLLLPDARLQIMKNKSCSLVDEKFTWDKIVKSYITFFNSILNT